MALYTITRLTIRALPRAWINNNVIFVWVSSMGARRWAGASPGPSFSYVWIYEGLLSCFVFIWIE